MAEAPLTGHKSRAIFDRYNIIHEQELLEAGDQLVAYLAQQAQAPRGRSHPASPRTASPLRLVRRSTARLCAAARARATRYEAARDRGTRGDGAGRCCMKDLLRVGRFGPPFSSPQEPHCRDAVEGSSHV